MECEWHVNGWRMFLKDVQGDLIRNVLRYAWVTPAAEHFWFSLGNSWFCFQPASRKASVPMVQLVSLEIKPFRCEEIQSFVGSESHNKQLPKKQGALTGAPSTEMAGMKWSVVTVCRDTSTAPQHALLASFLTTEQLAPHLVTSPTGSTLHQMISTYIKCMSIYVHQIWSLQVQQLYKVVPHS